MHLHKHKKHMSPIFYFLLALTAFLATRADAGGAVRDSDGDIISGGSYYVKTVFLSEGGGGLSLTPSSDSPCPLYIGQEWSRLDWGIPVNFSNWKSRVGFVPESENLNIEMDVKATVCVKSTYWWLSADKGRPIPIEVEFVKATRTETLSKTIFEH
ncbi:hypothetical protein HID58_047353 [Brassica napus]|uniref:Uncharacterized protein n=1 Tax=Brassica napus TaxID=3708 RepID=A0ABQ8AZ12_BRANA|nr:hypothetical protein HID58_047353 [Brassica napus]